MKALKNHPFAVEAHFEHSLVLTFAVPKEQLEERIPECLELDTYDDTWAFVAVAMVQTQHLRPKGFPKWMGSNFFLIGYRIFVRYTNQSGKRLRGLFILKSETDSARMTFFGNMFTHYHYSTTDVKKETDQKATTIRSKLSAFEVRIEDNGEVASLPAGSPFTTWKEARRFAGPLPHTFTFNEEDNTVLIIEGKRSNWKPQAVNVRHCTFGFINSMQLDGAILANTFEIKDIPYTWKKGKLEKWK